MLSGSKTKQLYLTAV